jgi:hypothetical protein
MGYLYWIVQTEIPLDKIIPLTKYFSSYPSYAGLKLIINEIPNKIATIKIRIRKKDLEPFPPPSLKYLLNSFDKILLFHTVENQDTWEFAHTPINKFKNGQEKNFEYPSLHKDGILILGKDTENFPLCSKFLLDITTTNKAASLAHTLFGSANKSKILFQYFEFLLA